MSGNPQITSPLWIEAREVNALDGQGIQFTSSATRKVAVEVTDEMLQGVRNSLKSVWRIVEDAFAEANNPDELVIKFGIKLAAKAGASALVIVSEAEGEATFALEAKWKKQAHG